MAKVTKGMSVEELRQVWLPLAETKPKAIIDSYYAQRPYSGGREGLGIYGKFQERAAREKVFNQEVRNGQVALGCADDTFHGGRVHFSEVYGDDYANEVKAELERQGVSVTSRTDYDPSLAEFKGDPDAVIEGRSTLRKRRELLARAVDVAPFADSPKLSKQLINERAIDFAKEHPDEFAKMDNADVESHMSEKHGRSD